MTNYIDFGRFAVGLAIGVYIPWLLSGTLQGWRLRFFQISVLAGLIALVSPIGSFNAVAGASLWLVNALLLTYDALPSLRSLDRNRLQDQLPLIGRLFLIVACVWLLFSRLSVPLGGFDEPWKTFTAVHFHYTGFLLSHLLAALFDPRRYLIWVGIAAGVVFSIPLTAIGIVGVPPLETLGVCAITLSIMTLNFMLMLRGGLFAIAGLVGIVPIVLAFLYHTKAFGLDWPRMAFSHGAIQSLVWIPLLIYLSKKNQGQPPG